MTAAANAFYTALAPQDDFAALADTHRYAPLPGDWWVGTSDIAGSTKAVASGHYKTVNMIAAAVISAQINSHHGADFPYIFGGDGAGFAVPPAWRDRAATALAAVRAWAGAEFGMELRVGLLPVAEIRAAGHDVTVARFRASRGVSYAMFAGGGLCWAEAQMKSGQQTIPDAPPGTQPDLTGLSCRWSHMPARHGAVLSVVMLPIGDTPGPEFTRLARQVAELAAGLDCAGHPGGPDGPDARWPPPGAALEAHTQRRGGSFTAAWCKAHFTSFIAWLLLRTGIRLGGFDARRYRRVLTENADFRKFEDGLKMTLDCDAGTEARLRTMLEEGAAAGVLRYGLHGQPEAMMTCIVPSVMADDHVHFVDGAGGGYTAAAQAIKGQAG